MSTIGDSIVNLLPYAFEFNPSTFFVQWAFIILLVILSGMFSGLNLGLMSLDKLGLEIVIQSGTPKQSLHARRIYPIRKRGNLLLCTILLGNVAVNALLSILLADFTSGAMGFILSTGIIVVCGEIIPQAICSRHGLAVGYYTVWIIWAFLIVLLPLSYPISKLLDCILGRELGTLYSRNELKKLLEMHSTYSDITKDETTIMSGALDFGKKEVIEVMTPLEDVYMLDIDSTLNMDTISSILEKGYSRIPVYEGSSDRVTGLLFVKDLALLNPEDNLPVRKILQVYGRNLPRIHADTSLAEVLAEFKRGQSHIAVVRRVNNEGEGDPTYENIGIVTLEDVIEEILQDEIIDETDVYMDNKSQTLIGRAGLDYKGGMGAAKAASSDQVADIGNILRGMPEFSEQELSETVLEKLIQQSIVAKLKEGDPDIYTEGKPESFCVVIISGKLQLSDGQQVYEKGPGAAFGLKALKSDSFVPEYTVSVHEPATIIKISKRAYTASIQATLFERGGDPENMFEDDF
mmetsp:Transcript_21841/g.27860  ORF Transcript_21841/g.27860 Transcript_21841/m.27860 type:complete len:519 (-) Transcript_21841:145-1701(-)